VTEQADNAASAVLANDAIGQTAASSLGADLEWEFFCECGAVGCQQMVMLTLDAFSAIRAQGVAVLAPGHQLTEVGIAGQSRAKAADLRDSAKALHAQAEQQMARARKHRR
jgi:hypothetical protein